MKKTRVLIVDDHPFFRAGLAAWVNAQPDLLVAGEADSPEGTLQAAQELRPDLLLLDLRLKEGDGLDLIRGLAAQHPGLRILVVSQHDEMVYAHRVLAAGARGYLMKEEATGTMREAIDKILAGEVYVSRRVAARLLDSLYPNPAAEDPQINKLTERELQVFRLLGSGSTTAQAAAQLGVSAKTVETYRERIKQKLDLPHSQALLRLAVQWVETGKLGS